MRVEASQLRRLSDRLTGYAVSRGLSRPDAEDCAQETVLILARKYPGKEESDLVPLAFRIIRWKIWEHRRQPSVLQNRSAIPIDELKSRDHAVDGRGNPEEIAALKEVVHRALDRIGRKCREMLLWQLEGLTGEEIARKMGLGTRNAAYIALNRCRKRFRKAFESLQKQPWRRSGSAAPERPKE